MKPSHALSNYPDAPPVRVTVPRSYDGIGQALRSAFRDHREPTDGITLALRRLDSVD